MDNQELLNFMKLAEQLKNNTRHSWTSVGRKESVAEHTYRLMIFAWLLKEEFPDYNMERVYKLCLFHDLGEAVTGDIPCFEKEKSDENKEEACFANIVDMLSEPYKQELFDIYREIVEKKTKESMLLHALDKMEAVIQHNEAPISTWLPLEYDLQQTYGQEQAEFHLYLKNLREKLRNDTLDKIKKESKKEDADSEFTVSSDKEKIVFKRVLELMRQSHWGKNRAEDSIRNAMDHSQTYGVYNHIGHMIGYARVITDYTTTFYLCDVIIDEAYRRKGAGTLLMDSIMKEHGHLHGVLHTDDAAAFYEKYGFKVYQKSNDILMEKPGTAKE